MTLKITDDVFLDQAGHPRRIRGVTVNSASPLLVSLAAQVGFEAGVDRKRARPGWL